MTNEKEGRLEIAVQGQITEQEGKWSASVRMTNNLDDEVIERESGYIFDTDIEARAALLERVNELTRVLINHGGVIDSKNGVQLS